MAEDFDHRSFKVRVVCKTYNHAAYIKDALDGFVMQQTSFPFVCAIVDDASTDGEQTVIRAYLEAYFDFDEDGAYSKEAYFGHISYARHKTNRNCYFVVVCLKENHFSQKKSKYPYIAEWRRVKYSALCEGDDYWTDSLKLQKQVDYLESHPDCMLAVHSANWKTGDNLYPYGCQDSFPRDYSVEELIRCGGYYFATASFVYRSKLNLVWPEWRKKASVGDYPLQILSGLRGDVHYLPDNMCVYRYQNDGSWSHNQQNKDANNAFQKKKIEWMTLLDEETGHSYQKAIYDQLVQHFNSLFHLREISFWDYAKAVSKSGKKEYGRLMKDYYRVCLKPLFKSIKRESHV